MLIRLDVSAYPIVVKELETPRDCRDVFINVEQFTDLGELNA
jgi:hypothetical protein